MNERQTRVEFSVLSNCDTLNRSRVELYDIPRDPSELNNLAGRQPQIVARLTEKALIWQRTLPAGPVGPSLARTITPGRDAEARSIMGAVTLNVSVLYTGQA